MQSTSIHHGSATSNSFISVGDIPSAISSSNIPKGSPQPSQTQVETACWQQLKMLPSDQQCAVLSQLFATFLKQNTSTRCPPSDFLELVVRGMTHLQQCGRSNVIYMLAKALGTMRPDQSDSLLPAKRMPMGLIEYVVLYFTASSTRQVCNHVCLYSNYVKLFFR